jgi:plastocyanin
MAAAITACGLFAMPAAAQAGTKTVDMGVPVKSQSELPAQVDVNDFFPHSVTIRAGDTVRSPAEGRRPAAADRAQRPDGHRRQRRGR